MTEPSQKQGIHIHILNIALDRNYLVRRHAILSDAGFEVRDATSVKEVLELIQESVFQIAIFGHLLPAADRLRLSEALKQRNPSIRLVVMYNYSVNQTERADAVLQINLPPADLVHTVEYLIFGR